MPAQCCMCTRESSDWRKVTVSRRKSVFCSLTGCIHHAFSSYFSIKTLNNEHCVREGHSPPPLTLNSCSTFCCLFHNVHQYLMNDNTLRWDLICIWSHGVCKAFCWIFIIPSSMPVGEWKSECWSDYYCGFILFCSARKKNDFFGLIWLEKNLLINLKVAHSQRFPVY